MFDHAVPERHSAGVGVLEARRISAAAFTAARRPRRPQAIPPGLEVEPVESDTRAQRLRRPAPQPASCA